MTQWETIARSLGKNLALKFLALGLSLALWFHISRKGQEYFSLSIPVTVTHLPDRLELKSARPDRVTLTLEGPPGIGSRIHPETVSILLDGRAYHPGRQVIVLTRSMLTLPPEASVVRMTPRAIDLTLLPLAQKTVPILPEFEGQEKDRITPLRIRITPERATIEGDTSDLASIHSLRTEPIDLSTLSGDSPQTFEISLAQPAASQVRILAPRSVSVTIAPIRRNQ